ncbi:hypothetical protein P5V15_015872 [Pogonomyrmex californicus]
MITAEKYWIFPGYWNAGLVWIYDVNEAITILNAKKNVKRFYELRDFCVTLRQDCNGRSTAPTLTGQSSSSSSNSSNNSSSGCTKCTGFIILYNISQLCSLYV